MDATLLVILLEAIYFLIGNYIELFKTTMNVESLDKQNNYGEQNSKRLPPTYY